MITLLLLILATALIVIAVRLRRRRLRRRGMIVKLMAIIVLVIAVFFIVKYQSLPSRSSNRDGATRVNQHGLAGRSYRTGQLFIDGDTFRSLT